MEINRKKRLDNQYLEFALSWALEKIMGEDQKSEMIIENWNP